MTRRQMRENCFILLFEHSFTDYTADELFESVEELDDFELDDTVKSYYLGITEHETEIDEIIKGNLKNWTMDRISRVSLSLLRLSVYEMCVLKTIDPPIAINEALELAKKYSTQDDANYMNGVLGSIVRGLGE